MKVFVGGQSASVIAGKDSTRVVVVDPQGSRVVTVGTQGPEGVQGPAGPQGDPGLLWRGAWASDTTYSVDDVVSHSGSAYVAVAENTNDTPPSANWNLLASKGDQGDTGPQGPQGDEGPTGAQGPQGAQGPTGAQGPEGLVWRGDWQAGVAYSVDDAVVSGGSSYVATSANTGDQPPSVNWDLLAAKGDMGEDKHFVHEQSAPVVEATIVHGLGKFPAVEVVDSAGTHVEVQVTYDDINTVTITSSSAFSYTAYFN